MNQAESHKERTETLEKSTELDLGQSFNDIEYSCSKCSSNWNSKQFLEFFDQHKEQFGGILKTDWQDIRIAALQNLFRDEDDLIEIVCPACSTDSRSGDIEVSLLGESENREALTALYSSYEREFQAALYKLSYAGKAVDWNGKVVDR